MNNKKPTKKTTPTEAYYEPPYIYYDSRVVEGLSCRILASIAGLYTYDAILDIPDGLAITYPPDMDKSKDSRIAFWHRNISAILAEAWLIARSIMCRKNPTKSKRKENIMNNKKTTNKTKSEELPN